SVRAVVDRGYGRSQSRSQEGAGGRGRRDGPRPIGQPRHDIHGRCEAMFQLLEARTTAVRWATHRGLPLGTVGRIVVVGAFITTVPALPVKNRGAGLHNFPE